MKTKSLVMMAFFTVLVVVFGFISIQFPLLRISFKFVPFAIAGYIMGPVPTALVGLISDFMGFYIKPVGFYHPGFALSAILSGLLYGTLKYSKTNQITKHISVITVLIAVIINIGLNTLWLDMMYGKGWLLMLPQRAIVNGILIPIEIFVLNIVLKLLKPKLERWRKDVKFGKN